MTVLVTGANGFVGSHVVRQLIGSDNEVFALVRPGSSRRRLGGLNRVRFLEADLDDGEAVDRQLALARPDACIHLAWYAEPEKYIDAADNLESLRASLALLESLAQAGCRHIVGVGTCAEYRMGPSPLHEDSASKPETLYAACKLAFSLVAAQRLAQLNVGFAWARLFYLYGPLEDERRLVPSMIETLTAGREFPATSGEQVRDYLHVQDVASALCALSSLHLAGTFNVCSGLPITIAELMKTVGELMGRPEAIRLGALPYRKWEPMYVCGDNRRLREGADWAPRFSLRDGLADMIECSKDPSAQR